MPPVKPGGGKYVHIPSKIQIPMFHPKPQAAGSKGAAGEQPHQDAAGAASGHLVAANNRLPLGEAKGRCARLLATACNFCLLRPVPAHPGRLTPALPRPFPGARGARPPAGISPVASPSASASSASPSSSNNTATAAAAAARRAGSSSPPEGAAASSGSSRQQHLQHQAPADPNGFMLPQGVPLLAVAASFVNDKRGSFLAEPFYPDAASPASFGSSPEPAARTSAAATEASASTLQPPRPALEAAAPASRARSLPRSAFKVCMQRTCHSMRTLANQRRSPCLQHGPARPSPIPRSPAHTSRPAANAGPVLAAERGPLAPPVPHGAVRLRGRGFHPAQDARRQCRRARQRPWHTLRVRGHGAGGRGARRRHRRARCAGGGRGGILVGTSRGKGAWARRCMRPSACSSPACGGDHAPAPSYGRGRLGGGRAAQLMLCCAHQHMHQGGLITRAVWHARAEPNPLA